MSERIFDLPVLPMKNTALLPNLVMPLSVGRSRSLAAVEAALATEDKEILLISQKDASVEAPGQNDLYTYGTRAIIRKMSRNNDLMDVLVMGVERVMLLKIEEDEPFLMGRVQPAPMPEEYGAEVEALRRADFGPFARRILDRLRQSQHPSAGRRSGAGCGDARSR